MTSRGWSAPTPAPFPCAPFPFPICPKALVPILMYLKDRRLTPRQRSTRRVHHFPHMLATLLAYTCRNAERARFLERGSMSLAEASTKGKQG